MAITLVQHVKQNTNSNQNTVDVTGLLATTTAGTVLMVGAGGGSGAMTITGVADGGDTFTQATSAQSTEATNGFVSDIWYCLSGAGGKTNITVTFSATSTANKDIWVAEISGFTTAVFDIAGHTTNAIGVATVDTGPLVTTTGTTGFGWAVIVTEGSVAAMNTGNEFTFADATSSADASGYLISSTAAAHQPIFKDGGATSRFACSVAFVKESGGGGGGTNWGPMLAQQLNRVIQGGG